MQSFIKIRGAVLEKNADDIMTLRDFNKDQILIRIKYGDLLYTFELKLVKFKPYPLPTVWSVQLKGKKTWHFCKIYGYVLRASFT